MRCSAASAAHDGSIASRVASSDSKRICVPRMNTSIERVTDVPSRPLHRPAAVAPEAGRDQRLRLEDPQRLADRRPTQAGVGHQRPLGRQDVALAQLAAEHALAQPIGQHVGGPGDVDGPDEAALGGAPTRHRTHGSREDRRATGQWSPIAVPPMGTAVSADWLAHHARVRPAKIAARWHVGPGDRVGHAGCGTAQITTLPDPSVCCRPSACCGAPPHLTLGRPEALGSRSCSSRPTRCVAASRPPPAPGSGSAPIGRSEPHGVTDHLEGHPPVQQAVETEDDLRVVVADHELVGLGHAHRCARVVDELDVGRRSTASPTRRTSGTSAGTPRRPDRDRPTPADVGDHGAARRHGRRPTNLNQTVDSRSGRDYCQPGG